MNLREPDTVLSVIGYIHPAEEGDLGRFKHVGPHDQWHYTDEWKDLWHHRVGRIPAWGNPAWGESTEFHITSQLALEDQVPVVGRGPLQGPLLLTTGLLELDLSSTPTQMSRGNFFAATHCGPRATAPPELDSTALQREDKQKCQKKGRQPSRVDGPSLPQLMSGVKRAGFSTGGSWTS